MTVSIKAAVRWSAAVLVAGAAIAATAACSTGGSKPAPTPEPSPSMTARQVAEREATAAYTGMWLAMAKAAETSNSEDPEVLKYAAGDALALLTQSLITDKVWGKVSKGRPELHPAATAATPGDAPTEVQIRDCANDASWIKYNKDTGKPWDDEKGGNRLITATVAKADGAWKVTKVQVGKVGSC